MDQNQYLNGMPPECVSIKSLSAMLDIPERTIQTWVYKRSIPYYKIGKLVRFDLAKVRAWYGRNFMPVIKKEIIHDPKI